MKGYISSYTLFILSIYLIIISTYSAQYSIKLKQYIIFKYIMIV